MQNNTQHVVTIKDIHKHYTNEQLEHHALQGVSLEVQKGEFIAITGPSGCGKSTLLSIIGLMDSPNQGTYVVAGINTTHLTVDQRTQIRNQHIGFVFQSFNLIDNMTVFENVALPLEYQNEKPKQIKQRVLDVLTQMDMLEKKDYKPNQLSGGQQQRIAIARALVTNPDLILVDEPTGNLDSKNGDQVMALLQQLNSKGSTIVMVTHDSRYAQCASRQIQLLDGKVVSQRTQHTPQHSSQKPQASEVSDA